MAPSQPKAVNDNPKNIVNGQRLREQLAKEQQSSEKGKILFEGGKDFRDAHKYVEKYGGKVEDWVKKTSSSYEKADGKLVETHWVENIKNGQRVDFKTKERQPNHRGNEWQSG